MIIKSEAGFRRMFASGAWFNWIAVAVLGFGNPTLFRALGITPVAEPALFLHLFLAAVFVFGYAYHCVSRDLSQVVLVQLGMIGKLLVFAVIGAYWLAGVASWHLVVPACVDLVYAILFLDFLHSRRVLVVR